MKVLNKSTIIARNEVEHTKSEKEYSYEIRVSFPRETSLLVSNTR